MLRECGQPVDNLTVSAEIDTVVRKIPQDLPRQLVGCGRAYRRAVFSDSRAAIRDIALEILRDIPQELRPPGLVLVASDAGLVLRWPTRPNVG